MNFCASEALHMVVFYQEDR